MSAPIADYLWFLLPTPLKSAAAGVATDVRRTVDVLGTLLDDARAAAFTVRRAWFPQTGAGAALDLHGLERQIARGPEEADDAYCVRLAGAFELYEQSGTVPGMVLAMTSLGHEGATVIEPRDVNVRLDGSRVLDGSWFLDARLTWATFMVQIAAVEGGLDNEGVLQILRTVRKWKPAHTRLAELVLDFGDLLEDLYPEAEESLFFELHPDLADLYAWPARFLDGSWLLDGSVLLDQELETLQVEVLPA